jgi:hypothetical protein
MNEAAWRRDWLEIPETERDGEALMATVWRSPDNKIATPVLKACCRGICEMPILAEIGQESGVAGRRQEMRLGVVAGKTRRNVS